MKSVLKSHVMQVIMTAALFSGLISIPTSAVAAGGGMNAFGTIDGGTALTLTQTTSTICDMGSFSPTNFPTGVFFNGILGTSFSYNWNTDSNHVYVTTPAGVAGLAQIRYQCTDGITRDAAANLLFTYMAHPAITSISPASGILAGGNSVTITGTNLDGATGVSIGGNGGVVLSNTATSAVVAVPTGTAGEKVVTFAGTWGSVSTTSGNGYTYVAAPLITSISPPAGPLAGGSGNNITIIGLNFIGSVSVTIDGNAATVVSNTGTTLVVTPPTGTAGTKTLTITAVGGSASSTYAYWAAPTFTSISPSTGSTAGGDTATITGTNLNAGTTVTVGGNSATINTLGGTSLEITLPAGSGVVNVVITTYGGVATGTGVFTYIAPSAPSAPPASSTPAPEPAQTSSIVSLTPSHGPSTATSRVTVAGNFIVPITNISVDGMAINRNSLIQTASGITFDLPAHASGIVTIQIFNGQAPVLQTLSFTYDAVANAVSPATNAPSVSSISTPAIPLAAELAPNECIATTDGAVTPVTVSPASTKDSLNIDAAGWNLGLGATTPPGTPAPLNSKSQIVAQPGVGIKTNGTGFKPNSTVTVYIYSDAIRLGDITTDSLGNFVGQLPLPDGLTLGNHTLQVDGVTTDNKVRSANIGIIVASETTAIRSTKPIIVTFPFDGSALSAAASKTLASIENAQIHSINITGYAQPTNPGYDQKLSLKRAVAVKKYIASKFPGVTIRVSGAGGVLNPLCLGAKNKCVVLTLQ